MQHSIYQDSLDSDRHLLKSYATELSQSGAQNPEQALNFVKSRILFEQVFIKPIEALFSTDKAIYLGERGYEPSVCCYVPFDTTPRNHLVIGTA